MGRIITILGVILTVFSAKLTWASIEMIGLNEQFSGFSKNSLFGNMPGLVTAIMGLLALILGLINRKFFQTAALFVGCAMVGWGFYQYYDKATYFAIQEGFNLNKGIYLHAFAPILVVIGPVIAIRKINYDRV